MEAYEALLREKRGKESFTDIILKLTAKKGISLLNFAGKWAGEPKELDEALSELNEMWSSWSRRVLR